MGKSTGAERNHGQRCWEQLPKAGGNGPELSLIPVHLRARKALGLSGVSNKWLYCACPAGVWARAHVMGTTPLLLRREGRCGLSGLAWRLCSLLTDLGPLPQSPSLAVFIIFPRRAEPHVRVGCAGDAGGGRCGSQRRVKDGITHIGLNPGPCYTGVGSTYEGLSGNSPMETAVSFTSCFALSTDRVRKAVVCPQSVSHGPVLPSS